MRSRIRDNWVFLAGCAALVTTGFVVASTLSPTTAAREQHFAAGNVVDETGRPVAGATVTAARSGTTVTDDNGHFRLATEGSTVELVTVTAPGHMARTQLFDPQITTHIVATTRAEDSTSLRFGGDVMMGRRYYEGTATRPPLLAPGATAEEHAALLENITPLLEDADITVVNLETPLVSDPDFDQDGPRPSRFHPTKDLAFASSPETARALKLSGVDVVALGNNHIYDALADGLDSTVEAVESAGLAHFGAGRTPDEAWEPAIVDGPEGRIAFLGCTTVDGDRHAVKYVATDTQGGSAACGEERLIEEVESARMRADVVVVMIHGGIEYRREQTGQVRDLSRAARQAGATLVVNSHPHVVGGITASPDSVEVESTGNLLFDQDLWDTFPSYLVRTDLHGNRVAGTSIDPIVIDGYRPRPAAGPIADRIARIATGTTPAGVRLAPSGILGPNDRGQRQSRLVTSPSPAVARIGPGWSFEQVLSGDVRVGTDLLNGTGFFTESGFSNATGLWTSKEHATLTRAGSCTGTESDLGMEMVRSPLSSEELVANPLHRAKLTDSRELSLLVDVRHSAPGAVAELHWYREQSGDSMGVTSFALPDNDVEDCRTLRFDAAAPEGATAVLPYVRLIQDPRAEAGQRLAVDNVSLIQWAPRGASGPLYDTVSATGGSTYSLTATSAANPQVWGEPRTYEVPR